MPKKHHNTLYSKPSSSVHPSLAPSLASPSQNGRLSLAAASPPSSVNDLISHLRQTQVRDEQAPNTARVPTMGTVHPSLRNLLDVPEVQPPNPRPGTRHTGPSRTRRIPGPPPPRSWLIASSHASEGDKDKDLLAFAAAAGRIQHQASSLPGAAFPTEKSLQHIALKAMAKEWQWHLEYDSFYLASIPTRLKELLLSYVAIYTEEGSPTTLRRLFPHVGDDMDGGIFDENIDDVSEVKRLDLTNALGPNFSLRQLTRDIVRSVPNSRSGAGKALRIIPSAGDYDEDVTSAELPESWDDSASDEDSGNDSKPTSLPTTLESPVSLRFKNLSHLSLGLSPTTRSLTKIASWQALLSLAPHISTLSSLSLAHWPPPTLTPNAAATFATVKDPVLGSFPFVSYGGSNYYSSYDGDWEEAAGILKRLSRALYCLKWLDLTGCGAWFDALTWKGKTERDGPSFGVGSSNVGADWNGAWRGIEHVGLGVGWTPAKLDDEAGSERSQSREEALNSDDHLGIQPGRPPTLFALMSTSETRNNSGSSSVSRHNPKSSIITQDWDVEEERRKYYKRKEVHKYMQVRNNAQLVATHLREIRRAKGGKWIDFDFGADLLSPP